MRRDPSIGDCVKRLVLIRWEQYKKDSEKLRERVELAEEPEVDKQNMVEPNMMKIIGRARQARKGPL